MVAVRQAPAFEAGALSTLTVEDATADLRAYSKLDHARFGTGWSVDETCGQVGLGEMALVWGRSGCSKSTWTLNVLANTPSVPTLVVNMEMKPRQQVEWLTSMSFELDTPGRDIESVLHDPEDDRYTELEAALDKLSEHYPALHFVCPTRPSLDDLTVMLDDVEDATGTRPVRVFIDHLGLMAGANGYEGYTRLAGDLHAWGLRENVALYVLQQTGRGAGDGQRNDGHIPVTLSSGVYAGEADADWVYGLYRPDRHPKFKRQRWDYSDAAAYLKVQSELNDVRNISVFQVLKNRPFSDVLDEGIKLSFNHHTRRLEEVYGY